MDSMIDFHSTELNRIEKEFYFGCGGDGDGAGVCVCDIPIVAGGM